MDEKNRSGGQEGVDFARLGDGRYPGRALAGDLPQRFRCFAPDSEGFVSAGPVGDLNRGDRFRVGVGGLHASREQSGEVVHRALVRALAAAHQARGVAAVLHERRQAYGLGCILVGNDGESRLRFA